MDFKKRGETPFLKNMCLYPKLIRNKRYLAYTYKSPKNWGRIAEECNDPRKLWVAVGCGQCYECRRQKAQQWKVRLMEELKNNNYSYFVTLTFSPEEIKLLYKNANTNEANKIAKYAIRHFLERWRKKNKKSLKHWLITELGQEKTERVHLHGIIFTNEPINNDILQTYWKYGRTDIGKFCNEMTINYIVKYVTKIDITHKNYKSIVLCSAGIGSNFLKSTTAKKTYKFEKNRTPEYYTLKDGRRVALPIYYRNKFYTQRERDELWTERLDKNTIYVNGIEIPNIDTTEGYAHYIRVLAEQQKWNDQIGYGNREWTEQEYTAELQKLNETV